MDKKVLLLIPGGDFGGIRRVSTFVKNYCKEKFNVEIIEVKEKKTVVEKFFYFLQIFKASRNANFIVTLHLNLMKPLSLYRNRTVILFTHGIEIWNPDPRLPGGWTIISNSKMNYAFLNGLNPQARVFRAYYPGFFSLNSSEHQVKEHSGLRLFSVSRLEKSEPYKGFQNLFESVERIISSGTDIMLTVAGEGSSKAAFESRFSSGAIAFKGKVEDVELEKLYTSHDLFVLLSSHEGQGLVYLEAMSRGTPVMALKGTVAEEWIVDGENGFLCGGSAAEIQDKLMKISDPGIDWSRLRRNAFQTFANLKVVPRFESLLHTILPS